MPRILVVDDQTDVRAMISMILRLNRFEVTEADSVKAGLRIRGGRFRRRRGRHLPQGRERF